MGIGVRSLSSVIMIAILSGSAWADEGRNTLNDVVKCADIAAANDRLKCFDATVAKAQAALAAPPPAASQSAQAGEGGVLGWFGFERPVTRPEDFGKPAAPVASQHDVTSITAGVTEFAKNAYGRALFVLDNGQTWKQIDGDNRELPDLHEGEKTQVLIETGLMGGYDLSIVGRTGMVKVRRVQ